MDPVARAIGRAIKETLQAHQSALEVPDITYDSENRPEISWNNQRLTLSRMDLPQTLVQALLGEPLGKLIDHETLDLTAAIKEVKFHDNNRIVVHTDANPEILDLSTIDMKDAPWG